MPIICYSYVVCGASNLAWLGGSNDENKERVMRKIRIIGSSYNFA